jgi:GH35 family endo-1,4-beta-xylanase
MASRPTCFFLLSPVFCIFSSISGFAQLSLLPSDPLRAFALSGSQYGASSIVGVAVPGQPDLTEALHLRTFTEPPNLANEGQWAVRVRYAPRLEVREGDTVLAIFWMRCIECNATSGEGYTRLNVERNSSPYTKSISSTVIGGPEWRRFALAFSIAENYQPGQYIVDFWMGFPVQAVQIAGLSITNHGNRVPFTQLPGYTPYEGWQQDHPWRADALMRIERIRKTDLFITVKDSAGRPVPHAQVIVRQTRHAFGFGSAVAADGIADASPNGERYRAAIRELFNMAVLENDLKWPNWERNRQKALDALAWLRDHGIPRVRGHNLVWPGWRYLPADLQNLATNPEALRRRIDAHIADTAGTVKGQVEAWDVINEPYTNRDLQNILGMAEMDRWIRLAREADSTADLYINDYDLLSGGGANISKINWYMDLLPRMTRDGIPVNGFGFQGHFGSTLTSPLRMLQILDRFQKLGLKLEVTEFDVNIEDEQLQADFTRDFLITLFSHPAVNDFLMWGFWEGRHWLPRGAMFRRDWSLKPNGEVYKELVFNQWWTNVSLVTAETGRAATRVFYGSHTVEARSHAGQSAAITVTLPQAGANPGEVELILHPSKLRRK